MTDKIKLPFGYLNVCVAELQYIKVSDEKQETIEEVFQYLVSEEKKIGEGIKTTYGHTKNGCI